MIRLISFVKTQIQRNLFEFSCQSKNSNQFAGFFLSKHRCKWICLILPVKTLYSTQFSGFFLSKSKFDLKKTWKVTCKCWPDWFILSKYKFKKKLIENSLVSLIKSHYKSIFFLHSIILEFGCIFKYKFCKFLCSEMYDRNPGKMYSYLLAILKKPIHLTTRLRWSSGYDTCLSHKRPGFNSLSGMNFFFHFFTYSNIFFNLRLNSWLMTA